MTEKMTETKTEITTKMPFPDQDPMVQSLIRSQRLGLVEEDWETTDMALRL